MNESLTVRDARDLAVAPLEAPPAPVHHFPTAKERRVDEVNGALRDAYAKAGTLQLPDEERKALTAPFDPSLVEKRPHDGFNYIPHIHISDRLTRVFGPGQWTMIRRWENIEGNTIYAEWVMVVRGVFIGESVGAADYHPNNKKQNFSDVLESTRGEALRRIAAKYLSCGSEVWSPTFGRPKDKPAGPAAATAKTRAWMIAQLHDVEQQLQTYAIDKGWIMPDEPLGAFPLEHVPCNTADLAKLRQAVINHK